ncbi:hypothetical protein [Prosthecobacter vanneervenii]|uniref:Uncharacterized protein n=1 Tax=Prosthecobacter vanneervenii TaxID=48466 RepID=A0A7W8DKG5_9BACT|nr:hypothetical protein [Prosthecobacter vanneervenii]MBB5032841.1 hypothetical protein [Prosthecobacter vanneervenii]
MKTTLMVAALLASMSMAQAGPPITPAKIKKPLHLSQVKSIFRQPEPAVPAAPVTTVQKDGATTAAGAVSTTEPAPQPVSKKVHLNTFLNHPSSAPGPK